MGKEDKNELPFKQPLDEPRIRELMLPRHILPRVECENPIRMFPPRHQLDAVVIIPEDAKVDIPPSPHDHD